MRVYLDNSATTFPKPACVIEAMVRYMQEGGTNLSRSTSLQATQTGSFIFDLRSTIARFFGSSHPDHVCFTKNITESLNIVLQGLLEPGDKVLVSALEHNAVMRPLFALGANVLRIPVDEAGQMDLDFAKRHLPGAKALVLCHISNVSGDVMPLSALSRLCQTQGVPLIVDAAQSAGFLDIDMEKDSISCLCFTGHKALLGPTGIGGFVMDPALAKKIPPFIAGGTGSQSDEERHPLTMPDKFEAGTQNIVGLYGLCAGLEFIETHGLASLRTQEQALAQEFYQQVRDLENVRLIGSHDYANKAPVFSFDFIGRDNAEVSFWLSQRYQIDNRCALHCSPAAHKSYGTFPQGTVRLSFSHANTREQAAYAAQALRALNAEML